MLKMLTKILSITPRVPGKGSCFASLTVFIILLYLVNNLRYMGITQLNEPALISCLWSLNVVFGLAIAGNFVLLLYRPTWFFCLFQALIHAAAVNAFWFMYSLFPFNFTTVFINTGIQIILILIMICLFLLFLLDLYNFGIRVPFGRKRSIPLSVTNETDVKLPGETTSIQPQSEQLNGNPPLDSAEIQTANGPAYNSETGKESQPTGQK